MFGTITQIGEDKIIKHTKGTEKQVKAPKYEKRKGEGGEGKRMNVL